MTVVWFERYHNWRNKVDILLIYPFFHLSLDTGEGIPDEVMTQIYQPFFSTKSQSLGLGLSFCKLAVESNGGTIDVQSKVGEGTKVVVKLPL